MTQQLTVLIIDDSLEDREVYRRYLQQDVNYQYTILEAETGAGGLQLLHYCQPDGILLDFLLPDIDGLEFMAELKQLVGENLPAVIMLTGQGDESIAVDAMKNGVQDYLVKGKITPEIILSSLHSAIENVRLRHELRRSEERFRTSIENLLDCFGIYSAVRDTDGKIVDFRIDYVNPAACKSTMMSPEEQVGKLAFEIFPSQREMGLFAEYCQVVETGEALEKEAIAYKFHRGNHIITRLIDARISKLGDGFVVSWRDVTAKKQAEEQLRQSHNRFRLATEAVNCLIYEWNFENNRVERTEALKDIVGYTLDEAEPTQEWWWQLIHPDDRKYIQNMRAELEDIISCPDHFSHEYRVRHKDGSYRHILDRGLAIRNEQGKIIRLVGSTTDITAEKTALAEQRRAEEALRQSEERYRYLSEAVPQLVWICNPNGECEYFNQRWQEFTGQSMEEALGWGWIQVLHPEDSERTIQTWKEALSTGKLYEAEMRYRCCKDDSYHWFLARALPMVDKEGKIWKWFGTSTNIHEIKQLEAERNLFLESEKLARAEAETANRAKDDFVAMVSHDLRSPLNAIIGWSTLLRTRQLDEVAMNRALEIIERNAKSQAKILEDLLDISRILRGTLHLDLSLVNLYTIVATAVETAYPSASTKNIRLISQLDDSLPLISGDPNRLQQVLGNLLSNAIKFTPEEGSIEVYLSMKIMQDDSFCQKYAIVTVKDSGIGITPEFLPQIFERYQQADNNNRHQGLGLGLAIAHHITELHGGSIFVNSPGEGLGSTFTIQLPLEK
ncbi:PAS domain-containing protein [Calothrix sp. UHCC 0171]|uniref:PAS domain-containing protein n=1 Tax=Calothrix sp. UHCC 0171 TaxID=3110245 RepID=UPI002B1EC515|nr:PAS domain-containing protein [Calothrix sp. UHCC 0171]MEA5571164.1 PAS domain-containing protein [Calothrix sp. UHCC 0171]